MIANVYLVIVSHYCHFYFIQLWNSFITYKISKCWIIKILIDCSKLRHKSKHCIQQYLRYHNNIILCKASFDWQTLDHSRAMQLHFDRSSSEVQPQLASLQHLSLFHVWRITRRMSLLPFLSQRNKGKGLLCFSWSQSSLVSLVWSVSALMFNMAVITSLALEDEYQTAAC